MKKGPLFVLFLTVFMDLLGFGLIVPILPIYAKEIGASGLMIGIVVGGYSFMQFFFSSFWGRLSDRFGRRPIILVSIFLMMISYLLFAHATTLLLLLAARLLSGFGGANLSAAQAYISDVTPVEKRTGTFAILGVAFGLGFIFGPPIGGYLKEHYGLAHVGYAAAIFCVINFTSAWFFLTESNQSKKQLTTIFPNPFKDLYHGLRKQLIGQLLIINFALIMAFSLMQVTAALMWEEHYGLSEAQVGYVFAFIGLSAVIIQGGLIKRINAYLGDQTMLISGVFLLMIGLVWMPFVPVELFVPLELIALLLVSFGVAFLTPTINSMLSQKADRTEQGEVLGTNQSIGSLARFLGPMLGGVLYTVKYTVPYLASGVILLGVAFLAISLVRRWRRTTA